MIPSSSGTATVVNTIEGAALAAPAVAPGAGAAVSPPSLAPGLVTIPLEQMQQFATVQVRLAQLEAENREREAAAQREQVRLLAEKGEVDNALVMFRQQSEQQVNAERAKLSAADERAKRFALDGELARALSGHQLVQGGAEQLARLWRQEFSVASDGDTLTVRTPTFQSPADFVRAQLATDTYAHFVKKGETPTPNAAPATVPAFPHPAAAPVTTPQAPVSMSEAVIAHMQAMNGGPAIDARLDLRRAMGLKPTPAVR